MKYISNFVPYILHIQQQLIKSQGLEGPHLNNLTVEDQHEKACDGCDNVPEA